MNFINNSWGKVFTSKSVNGEKNENKWPNPDAKYLKTDNVEIVIQINGKKRTTITVNKGLKESKIILRAQQTTFFEKNHKNEKIEKSIYIKDRLLNLIIK